MSSSSFNERVSSSSDGVMLGFRVWFPFPILSTLLMFPVQVSCAFLCILWGFSPPPVSSLVSGPGFIFLSCCLLYLGLWASLLRVFISVSGPSGVLLLCMSLLCCDFVRWASALFFAPCCSLPVFPSCWFSGRGPHTLLFRRVFLLFFGFFCSFLPSGFGCLFFAPRPVSLVSSSLLSFGVGVPGFLCFFCLVGISGSLRDVVSLWAESGFAGSSVSLGVWSSFSVLVSLSLGFCLCWVPFLTYSHLWFP